MQESTATTVIVNGYIWARAYAIFLLQASVANAMVGSSHENATIKNYIDIQFIISEWLAFQRRRRTRHCITLNMWYALMKPLNFTRLLFMLLPVRSYFMKWRDNNLETSNLLIMTRWWRYCDALHGTMSPIPCWRWGLDDTSETVSSTHRR